ncbi:hypothetical protein MKX03_004888 [Papaver bracteatum]|nr:hypothetical protein MKX03_004888 [Papaver bracteatum]
MCNFQASAYIIFKQVLIMSTRGKKSKFSLGLVFVCISLFHIPSNSHSVAAGQLLIYVGAINVLIIFDVMFMNESEYYNDFGLWTVGDGVTSLVCTSSFVSLITTIPDTSWYGVIWTTRSNQILEQDLINKDHSISGLKLLCRIQSFDN